VTYTVLISCALQKMFFIADSVAGKLQACFA